MRSETGMTFSRTVVDDDWSGVASGMASESVRMPPSVSKPRNSLIRLLHQRGLLGTGVDVLPGLPGHTWMACPGSASAFVQH